jgi:hypothetical protein
MQGILENIPVGLMMAIEAWPLVLLVTGLPLLLWIVALRKGGWCAPRRRLGALAGGILGLVLGPMLAFAAIGGSLGDLRYWLDWLFLALVTGAAAVYCGLLLYLALPPR